jgi:hypothetical protein
MAGVARSIASTVASSVLEQIATLSGSGASSMTAPLSSVAGSAAAAESSVSSRRKLCRRRLLSQESLRL